MPQQSTAVSQWPTAERHVSFTKARKSRKWPWPSEAVRVVRGRGRHSWEVRPALRVRRSGRQLTLSLEGWPWSTPAWRMRRTGGAGRRGPSPRFLCPHRHLVTPGTVRTSPCPPAWLAGPSILHRLGTSVRIPREWFPQQQPPHGRFQNFRRLLAAPQRAQGRRTSASY